MTGTVFEQYTTYCIVIQTVVLAKYKTLFITVVTYLAYRIFWTSEQRLSCQLISLLWKSAFKIQLSKLYLTAIKFY